MTIAMTVWVLAHTVIYLKHNLTLSFSNLPLDK